MINITNKTNVGTKRLILINGRDKANIGTSCKKK